MTSSQPAVRRGSQTPRVEHYPLYATTAADDAVDLAAAVGLVLDPWQEYVLRGSLGEKSDGRWTAFRSCLVVPRQNGKNAVLEARELAGLFLFGERLIIHTAHEFSTARESMLSMMSRLRGSDLMEYVAGFDEGDDEDKPISGMKVGNTDPGITLKNGARLRYKARTGGGGRGFTGDLVVLDEAYALRLEEMAALLPTMAAKSLEGNPQVWFTSSAGMPESDLLASLRKQAMDRTGDRLAYFEWSTGDDRDPLDRDGWYEANPGLGIRISEEFIQDEWDTLAKETGSDEQFKRERLGIWAKLGSDPLITEAVWDGWADPGTEPGERLTFALDVPPDRASAVVGLVSWRPDGRLHVEIIDQRVGTSWVPSFLRGLQDRWGTDPVVVDAGGAAGSLLPDLKREGVRVREVSPREYGQACGTLFDLITDPDGSGVAHQGREAQAALAAAVEAAQKKAMGDTLWKWNRRNAVSDISPLVAVTLALIGAQKTKTRPVKARRSRVVVLGG